MYGEGHYALGNVKEIKVTSSYLNMDRAVTGCQNVESLVHCNNRKFRDQLQSTCNCFPPNLRDIFQEVGDGDGGCLSRSLVDKFISRAAFVESLTRPVLTRYRWSMRIVCPCVKDYPSPILTKTSPNITGN